MKLSALTAADASALAVRTLDLDEELISLGSTEGLAASLRRAASFMCPTSPSRLVDAVRGALRPVSPVGTVDRDRIMEVLDLLVSAGDLLDLRQEVDRSTRLLYLGPPTFIEREPGTYLLLGVRPYGASLVDAELAGHVEYEGHTRLLQLNPAEALGTLASNGLQQLDAERWAASPRKESAAELVKRVRTRLDVAGSSGDIEDLIILDPVASVRFYKGRWRTPGPADGGDFLARRPQAYGADLWCAVRVEQGRPVKLVEFPMHDPVAPARDEAWRFQMAVDAMQGKPQQYRESPVAGRAESVVSFFSPLPGFAERYLQLVGMALPDAPKALLAFRLPNGAIPAVSVLLTDTLWLQPLIEENAR